MQSTFRIASTLFALVALSVVSSQAVDVKKLQADSDEAIKVFKKTDPSMAERFKSAAGYVVFPNVGKGGFIVGGAHGNGIVYEKGKAIGQASLTQVSVGAQVGGQEFSEVIFFEDQKTLDNFKQSEWAMSAGVSAVASGAGASARAKYVQGVLVFTQAKGGLMAEASVGGQKFKYEPLKK